MKQKNIEIFTDSLFAKVEQTPPPSTGVEKLQRFDIQKLQLMQELSPNQLIQKIIQLNSVRPQTPQHKQLSQICYAQLGRKLTKTTQKEIKRQFTRTNIYIRAYMLKNIYSYVEQIAQKSQNSIFILPNVRGLHFPTDKKPEELTKYLEDSQYVEIIRNVNYIIQSQVFANKQSTEKNKMNPFGYSLAFILIFFILGSMIYLSLFTSPKLWNEKTTEIMMIIAGLFLGVVIFGIFGFSMHSFSSNHSFKFLPQKITEEIQIYFDFLNRDFENKLEFVIGQSFFWIQVKIKSIKNSKGRLKFQEY